VAHPQLRRGEAPVIGTIDGGVAIHGALTAREPIAQKSNAVRENPSTACPPYKSMSEEAIRGQLLQGSEILERKTRSIPRVTATTVDGKGLSRDKKLWPKLHDRAACMCLTVSFPSH